MKFSHTLLLAFSTLLFANLASAPNAFATADGPDHYRVVKVSGAMSLHMRSKPGKLSPTIYKLPFNARHLSNRIETRGRWALVEYKGHIGWVHMDYLAEDAPYQPTIYRVTGLENWDGLNLRKGPKAGSPIISSIPGSAKNIEESGICRGLWCPVRFDGIEGWVHKRFLSVVPYPDIPVARINPAVRDNQYSQYAPDPRHDRDISGRDFRQRYDDEYMGLNRRIL